MDDEPLFAVLHRIAAYPPLGGLASWLATLALCFCLSAAASPAVAQEPIGDPSPIIMSLTCVVIDTYTEFDNRDVFKGFDPLPTRAELAASVEANFRRGGYDIIVTMDREACGKLHPEQPDLALYATIRIDLTTSEMGRSQEEFVGSVNTVFYRLGGVLIAPIPATIFGGDPNDPDLSVRGRQAVFDHVSGMVDLLLWANR